MSIHYKFKSAKDFDTISFPGTVIRVIDLKKAIVEKKKLNKGLDFDLVITDAQNGKVYEDENLQLPRNTSVTIKRIPSIHPGSGLLARIKAEAACLKAINGPIQDTASGDAGNGNSSGSHENQDAADGGAQTLEDELAALESIHEQAEDLRGGNRMGNKTWTASGGSNVDRVSNYYNASNITQNTAGRNPLMPRTGPIDPSLRPRGNFAMPNPNILGKPPPNYVCYRCGTPGHYIQNCPTNGDPDYDQHRVKKKTGIPKSFMKAVSDPSDIPLGAGKTVVNAPWGGLAVIEPQNKNFSKLMAKSGGSATLDQLILNPPEHLACPLCKRLMNDAVLIPCCQESACDECLRSALLERNLICPLCQTSQMSPEKLLPNKVLRASVDEFLRRARSEQREREMIVKEAEEKAMARQKAADHAVTAARRSGETADAVLEIRKAGKKEAMEMELDDAFGGDIFENVEEDKSNAKVVEKADPDSANNLNVQVAAARPVVNMEGPPGTTPTQEFEVNANQTATALAPAALHPMPWNPPHAPPFYPEPWFEGARPPWFDGPGNPWFERVGSGPRGPAPGPTYPPIHFYNGPEFFGPPPGHPDYFGIPRPYFEKNGQPFHDKAYHDREKQSHSQSRENRFRGKEASRRKSPRREKKSRSKPRKSLDRRRSSSRRARHSPLRKKYGRTYSPSKSKSRTRDSKKRSSSRKARTKSREKSKPSPKLESSLKDIKIDEIGAPAIDLDFLNDEIVEDAEESTKQRAKSHTTRAKTEEKPSVVERKRSRSTRRNHSVEKRDRMRMNRRGRSRSMSRSRRDRIKEPVKSHKEEDKKKRREKDSKRQNSIDRSKRQALDEGKSKRQTMEDNKNRGRRGREEHSRDMLKRKHTDDSIRSQTLPQKQRHIEYEEDRKKSGRRRMEDSNRSSRKKRSVLDRLGPALD